MEASQPEALWRDVDLSRFRTISLDLPSSNVRSFWLARIVIGAAGHLESPPSALEGGTPKGLDDVSDTSRTPSSSTVRIRYY